MSENNNKITPVDFQSPEQAKQKSQWQISPIKVFAAIVFIIATPILFFILNAKAVVISTNAQNPNVNVSNSIHLPIGNSLLLLHGEHHVNIKAKGYFPLSQTLMVDGDTPQQMVFELAPLPGNLNVELSEDESILANASLTSEESGQTYFAQGVDSILFENIPAGDYSLVVDANLYSPSTQAITLAGKELTEHVAIDLLPNWGFVTAHTSPAPIQLFANEQQVPSELDDTENQLGHYSARLEAGTYKVELRLADYKPVVREFTLAPEQTFDFGETTLELVDSQVSLNTQPDGVTVLVNNTYAGETPVVLDLLPEINHEIRLFKTGFKGINETVKVAKNENLQLDYVLDPDLIQVSVSIFPQDATVIIDGKALPVDNNQISLTGIQHDIAISAAGYQSQQISFLPVRGTRQLLQVRLLTDEQALWANIPANYDTVTNKRMKLFREPGKVAMGSNRRETGRRANETQWQATLKRPFYISTTEVTNEQFKAFNPEHSSGNFNGVSLDGADQPVINISWQQAALYCNWLSEQEGLEPFYTTKRGFVAGTNPESTGYRLPTEAEWTWLAKFTVSGFAKKYMWGNEDAIPGVVANYADQSVAKFINFTLDNINDGFLASAPVASFKPNEKGIYDLSGNVNEWIHDWYAPSPYTKKDNVTDPLGPEEGEFHVIRGASWARGYLPQLRLAYRDYDSTGRNDLGFRVARYAM